MKLRLSNLNAHYNYMAGKGLLHLSRGFSLVRSFFSWCHPFMLPDIILGGFWQIGIKPPLLRVLGRPFLHLSSIWCQCPMTTNNNPTGINQHKACHMEILIFHASSSDCPFILVSKDGARVGDLICGYFGQGVTNRVTISELLAKEHDITMA